MQKAFLLFLGLLALGNAASLFGDLLPDDSSPVPDIDPVTTPVPLIDSTTDDPSDPVDSTTAAPVDSTTAAPVDSTTAAPVDSTTAAPVDSTTAAPLDSTTAAPVDSTTAAPVDSTTAAPIDSTTLAPVDSTTAAPGGTTLPIDSTTTALPTYPPTTIPGECIYPTQTWGVPDLTKFAFCLDGKAREAECNENQYYVSNNEVSGCLPAAKMDINCVNLNIEVEPCTGQNLKQPQPSQIPTNYWLCQGVNDAPVELTCPDGKAFYKQDGYLGCFEWLEWRKLRSCQTY